MMSKLKDMMPKDPVHERRLELRSYPVEDGRIIVEGWLRDERLVPGYQWDGQEREPGVVHWMCVRLLVGGWPLEILDAEAEMPGIPNELCTTTMDSVKKVIGMPIVSGFSEAVRERIGGVNGCAHLTYLIVTMGPAALHGVITQKSRQPSSVPKSLEEFPGLSYVLNSCRLWTEDGPNVQMIQETMERLDKNSGDIG